MKTAFYFATRQFEPENTLAYKSILRIKDKISPLELFYDSNNQLGLSERYNQILNKHSNNFDNIVFIHDDVFVDDALVCEKLERAHSKFDIVGLAGGVNPKIKAPALWHLMCGGFNGGNLYGAVSHPCTSDQIMFTNFGPTPARVAILDGLFLSILTKRTNETKWRFNENYNFHHYDIASCLDANKHKLKLGVAPIWVMHNSPGLLSFEDKNFLQSQEKFLKEYSSY